MKPSKMVGFFHVLIILISFQQVVKSYQEGGPGLLVRDEVSEIRPGDEYAITGNQVDNRQQGNVFEGKVQSQDEDQNYGSMNSLENEWDSVSNSVKGDRVAEVEVEERRNDQTEDKSEQQDEDTSENMEEDGDNATTENYGDNFDSIIDNENKKEAVAMLDYGFYTSKDEEKGITGIEDEGNEVDIMEAEENEDGIEKDGNDNEEDEVEVENEGNAEKEIEQDNEVKEEEDDTGRDNDGDGTGTEDEDSKTDIVEIEEEDETGKNEEEHKDGTTEENENDIEKEIEEETPEVEQVKDEIRMETKEGNTEMKDVSAENVEIEQGNDEDQDIVDYEGYVAKSDDDSKTSFRIEDSRRHVEQEKESEYHNEMAENEVHICKPSKNKNKIYKDKGRKKKEEKRKRRRKNKQRRHKKTRKDKQRRNRGRDKQKNSKNKQRKYKSGYKRKSGRKSRRNKGMNERYKNEIRLILVSLYLIPQL